MAKRNLHRREAVALPASAVTVTPGEVVVVTPEVVGKNSSHIGGRTGLRFTSPHTKSFRKSVHDGVFAWAQANAGSPLLRLATDGAWRLEVIGVWPTQNHDVGFVAPRGDADAAIPQALDALQHAGILDDDARVVEVRAWNLYRKGVRATVMRLVRLTGAWDVFVRDTAISHLLPLVPQSTEQPAKPKRARKVKS